ncbi:MULTISPECIES: SgcJ/EcaC family oxidoreductase [unclassified Streptomyces]|uniref:SgcJ/EcaC family oxidoreductase n=1 Tax=unclassified Streptomyces TaxID=2593676 RepID=UPI002F90D811|nr:SgcJ/EcaC family oxidoreductase [Streptomyces sp. NBC_01732]WSX07426.1 SgcJ/EcaC family oxidoreductase [Streptomyces sp. NBC_00987]
MIDAWQRHDAQAHGARFTVDATYITFVGTYYQGRADIVESHRTLFEKHLKGPRLADEVLDIRFHGPDAAVVTGRGDTCKGSRPQKLTKIQTYTLVREADGERRIAAFRNTKRKPLLEAISFRTAPGLVPAAQKQPPVPHRHEAATGRGEPERSLMTTFDVHSAGQAECSRVAPPVATAARTKSATSVSGMPPPRPRHRTRDRVSAPGIGAAAVFSPEVLPGP